MPLFSADDARKIAKVNAFELQELALSILLNKPENAAKKTEYNKLLDDVAVTQSQLEASKDEETRRQCQQRLSEASQKEQNFKKSLEPETKRVILGAIKEVSKGKYVAVLNDGVSENIIYKDAELVDITYDIKEQLLADPSFRSPATDGLQAAPPRLAPPVTPSAPTPPTP